MKIFAISGLGADKRVFEFLKLDHTIIPIDWITPKSKESISSYSQRLVSKMNLPKNEVFGIMGVSFGGLVAIEISKIVKPKITILISSIETSDELSKLFKITGKSNLINIIPRAFMNPPKFFAHYLFGTNEKQLLNSILNDTDLDFAKWAVRELLNWKNQVRIPSLIKIGGSKDKLLPPKGANTILIDKGEHFMIVDKAAEISEIINNSIQKFS